MNRLVAASLFVVAASILAACGDAGDHLFDFHQNHPTPTPAASGAAGAAVVTKVVLSLPQTPGASNPGSYPLAITLYNANNAVIPAGTSLASNVVLTSNDSCAVTFNIPNASGNGFTSGPLESVSVAPGNGVVLAYSPGQCTAQTITVTASLQSGTGSSGAISFFTPPPSSGGATAVSAIVVTLDSSPSPNTPGTYPVNITIFDQNGNIILPGTLLASNVVVTSNDDCAVTFGVPEPGQTSFNFGSAVTIDTAPGSGIILAYNPGSCSAQSVTVTVNLQSNAATFGTLSLFGGEATVTSVSPEPLATPNPVAAGVYPFFLNLLGTVNGGAIGALPSGNALANPVTITSDGTCVVGFGTTPNISTGIGTQALTITSSSTIVYMYFNPGAATSSCTSTATVIVSVSASGITTQTYTFTNGIPVASVRRR